MYTLFLAVFILLLVVLAVVAVFRRRSTVVQLRKVVQEVEESKCQLVAEQRRNQQLKQEMTNNIAHELKTPVSSIRGYLEILLGDKPVSDDKRRFFLDRCYQQTLRLSALINDVSLINKLEEADDLFPVESLQVASIVDEAMADLYDKAHAISISFDNNVADTICVQGNKSLLYAIFRNLVENAVAYAGEGVSVVVESYKVENGLVFFHFFDTGRGVDSKFLPVLFDRFLRVENGRSRQSGGTGLGLSIVKHAVIFHGGTIYVKNREQGGLEFFFSLRSAI